MESLSELLAKYHSLGLNTVLDFDKFNQYAITHHSTVIEGSTLTEEETQLLLDDGITPKGKPLLHSLMVSDHFKALKFVLQEPISEKRITPEFICKINSLVMANTGSLYNTVFGEINAAKGEFRKGNVRAGNSYFVSYDKVEMLVKQLCENINLRRSTVKSYEEKLMLSFDAHFDLVSIHPFYDGNGRTSRLLMNYLQHQFSLPLGIVHKENKAEYFKALEETRQAHDMEIFRTFMFKEYNQFLNEEIEKFSKAMKNKGNSGGSSVSVFF